MNLKVQDVMTLPVRACRPESTLEEAAQILWDRDCGFLPVVDEDGRVVGSLTDRDICMGAYTQGKRLCDLRVLDSMASGAFVCKPSDSVEKALSLMADRQVRRIPVVDGENRLQGVLSLNDLVRAAVRIPETADRHQFVFEFVESMASVCEPRATSTGEARARTKAVETAPRRRDLSSV